MFANSISYADSRIRGTFMLPKDLNRPLLYIDGIRRPRADATYDSLDHGTIVAADVSGPRTNYEMKMREFHFNYGTLGYVSLPHPVFVGRVPVRRDWRQGLRASQLYRMQDRVKGSVSSNVLSQNITAFTDTLRGKYCTIPEAIEKTEERGVLQPLSRSFALTRNYKVEYKGMRIVGALQGNDRLRLDNTFSFLTEQLVQEVGINNVNNI